MLNNLEAIIYEYLLRFCDNPKEALVFKGRILKLVRIEIIMATLLPLYLALIYSFRTLRMIILLPIIIHLVIVLALLCYIITPYLKLKAHFSKLEEDSYWLAVCTYFYVYSGRNVIEVLDLLEKFPLKSISIEVKALKRLIIMKGDIIDGLVGALEHCRTSFCEFIKFLESVLLYGVDAKIAAKDFLDSMTYNFKANLRAKIKSLSMFSSSVCAIYSILPTSFFIIFTILASSMMYKLITIFFVLLFLLTIIILSIPTPFSEERLFKKRYYKVIYFFSLSIILYSIMSFISTEIPHARIVSLTVSLLVLFSLSYFSFRRQYNAIIKLINDTPIVISEIVASTSKGENLYDVIRRLLETYKFSPISAVLKVMLLSPTAEEGLEFFKEKIPSVCYIALKLTLEAITEGSITIAGVLADSLREFRDCMRNSLKSLRFSRFVIYSSVVVTLLVMAYLVKNVLPTIAYVGLLVKESSTIPIPLDIISPKDVPYFVETLGIFYLLTSSLNGLVIGKLTEFYFGCGFKHSLIIIVICFIVLIVLLW